MKKPILVIIAILIMGSMFALDLDWDSEYRTRGAIYNDASGNPGGHVDNRLQLGFNTIFHPNLSFRANFEIENVWGNGGGSVGTNGVNVKTNELYINMMVDAIKSRVKLGQQYYADHRSLVLDDTFSGLSVSRELGENMNLILGYGKYNEGGFTNRYDDMQGLIIGFSGETPISYGADAYFTWTRNRFLGADPYILKHISFLPYAGLELDPLYLDATLIIQSNDSYNWIEDEVETDVLFGAAINAGSQIDQLELNADLLFLSDNGLFSLSDYYQNNLYLFGYGEHHDELGLWAFATGADSFLSISAQAKYGINEQLKAFGAAGFINKGGIEINGGVEYQLVPDLLGLALYGAYGIVDKDLNNKDAYAIGSTLKLEF